MGGLDPSKGRKVKIAAKGLSTINFGRETISLPYVEQLVDVSQTRAVGELIYYFSRCYVDGQRPLREGIGRVYQDLEKEGLDLLSPYKGQHPGDFAMPRKYELAAAINRMRSLKVK